MDIEKTKEEDEEKVMIKKKEIEQLKKYNSEIKQQMTTLINELETFVIQAI
jgi:hypothetical protein